jgi:hypothetical protein
MIDPIEPVMRDMEAFEEGHYSRREEGRRRALERLVAELRQRRQPAQAPAPAAPRRAPLREGHEWEA